MSQDDAKNAASLKALEFVEDGMRLGLGTGSTAAHFIEHLIEKCNQGLKIEAAATSRSSEKMAREGGVPMLDMATLTSLDLTIDGADEIDPEGRLVKGAGGALIREKIIATMSLEMIVIADETKLVTHLGMKHRLPLEVIPFAAKSTEKQLLEKGYPGTWRKNERDEIYITDNGNWILDIALPDDLDSPERSHLEMIQIPGVVDTGFFFDLASRIIIGKEDGSVAMQTKRGE
ncbi:MAG: Ribose-5-phosphate isomerase A [Chlamydiae bacterium]|nr:Ribose-5-phosphate isomerase A [Chlamydiota bacterium]